AWSSIFLLGVIVWSILDDYSREWKVYQRAFRQMEIERTEAQIGKTQAQLDKARKAELEKQFQAANAEVSAHKDRIEAIDDVLGSMANDLYLADQRQRFTKALLDAAKYDLEEARHHEPDRAKSAKAEYDRLNALLAKYVDANKAIQEKAEKLKAERRNLTASEDRLKKQMDDLEHETRRLQKALASINRPFTDTVLNAPMLDFINPTLKIDQFVVDGLENDLNFLSIPRVDRCRSCHMGIDKKEYVGAAEPFTAHHNLDLVGGTVSPHPFGQTGCTICHMGRDRATGFVEAAHTPDSPERAKAWRTRHHWERMHYWENPMFALRYVEAGCLQCHMDDAFVPGADKLSRGRELFETLGCHGCHKVAGWPELRKVGPPLNAIAAKTDRDWVKHLLVKPRAFRPTTRMPQFWFLSNSKGPEDRTRNNVEIEGIVEYLFDKSAAAKYPPPPAGNAARGKALVEKVGCHGCHSAIGPESEQTKANPRSHGPNLMRIGSKTYPGWLYQWVRHPKDSWPETHMPELRLNRKEAADITAYLSSLRDEDWKASESQDLDVSEAQKAAVLDEMVKGYLMRKETEEEAAAQLARLSSHEKKMMVGEKSISRYGCYGCHDIPGFEKSQRIGTELTKEGSKFVDRLDFGFVDIPHERADWFFQKLKDTRIFDAGKVKLPKEKLKMPDFYLSDGEAESLVTLLLGLRSPEVEPERKRNLDARQEKIQTGWRLIRDYNCTGCHLIEGRGGDIRPWIQTVKAMDGIGASEALSFAPPDLHTEGAKVQSDWLFNFIKDVTPIRPWLDVRMPTFHFDDDQVNTLTAFFAALENAPYPFVDYRSGFRLAAKEKTAADKLASKDYLNCLSCHQFGDRKPTSPPESWAPDLALARHRLRADWIKKWLNDPQQIMPGTRMPSFFLDEDSGPLDILGGDEKAQMDLLSRWVMSLGEEGAGQRAAGAPQQAPAIGKRVLEGKSRRRAAER
ncbi:MAG: c-type cytochrome, partial [Acidobacteriota bacterium]